MTYSCRTGGSGCKKNTKKRGEYDSQEMVLGLSTAGTSEVFHILTIQLYSCNALTFI